MFNYLSERFSAVAWAMDRALASAPKGALSLEALSVAIATDVELAIVCVPTVLHRAEDGTVQVGVATEVISAVIAFSWEAYDAEGRRLPGFKSLRKVGIVRADLYEEAKSAREAEASASARKRVAYTSNEFLAILNREGIAPANQVAGFVAIQEERTIATLLAGFRAAGIPDARAVELAKEVIASRR